jgi:hypothetical protein
MSQILDQEITLRADLKRLYEQFILDAEDQTIARRYVQQAYFAFSKKRMRKLVEERVEFHPFWGANPFDTQEESDRLTGEDNGDEPTLD